MEDYRHSGSVSSASSLKGPRRERRQSGKPSERSWDVEWVNEFQEQGIQHARILEGGHMSLGEQVVVCLRVQDFGIA
jgi:hypothetical protein